MTMTHIDVSFIDIAHEYDPLRMRRDSKKTTKFMYY